MGNGQILTGSIVWGGSVTQASNDDSKEEKKETRECDSANHDPLVPPEIVEE